MNTRSKVQEPEAHLTRSVDNAAFYVALSSAQHVTDISVDAACTLLSGYRLIRVDNRGKDYGTEFEIALIYDPDLSVVYYNRVTAAKLNSHPAIKCWGWRSYVTGHSEMLGAVIQRVFFNYLLERYDVLISNDPQGEGEFFWLRLISNAIASGHNVYVSESLTTQLHSITTQVALDKFVDEYWSNAAQQAPQVALISTAKLDTRQNCLIEERAEKTPKK